MLELATSASAARADASWSGRCSLAALLLVAGCATKGPARVEPAGPPVCWACFWDSEDPALRRDLVKYYGQTFRTTDPLVAADVTYLLGRVEVDRATICAAREAFRRLEPVEEDPRRRLLVEETLAFTAAECGEPAAPGFLAASEAARATGETWKAGVYASIAEGRFAPRFGESPSIGRNLSAPRGTRAFVLGESRIRVTAGTRVGAQVDRTVRDWLSYGMAYDFRGTPPSSAGLVGHHEGARLRDLLPSGAVVVPLGGVLAARRGGRWRAADERGTFRFEVLDDKVEYATTRAIPGLALLLDTHGISALVEPAVRLGVRLVVGCGDTPAKVAAAYHLARLGIDVYFPCDRFGGDLLGHDAAGTLIGSAPVRIDGGDAIIGDRPVRFRTDEPIVVEDTAAGGRTRYYDAPARYFARLATIVPIRVVRVAVMGPGQSGEVIRRAREIGAAAIGVRVETAEDAAPVRAWLAEAADHRAVLFHTAPYADGYRLYEEFPHQTTFGDLRPRFVTSD